MRRKKTMCTREENIQPVSIRALFGESGRDEAAEVEGSR